MAVFEHKEWTQIWYDEAQDDKTPRVMMIGDSICVGYRNTVNVHLNGAYHADSIGGSKALDNPCYRDEIELFARQLGYDNYRLIHFNNGLHGGHLSPEAYGRLYEDTVCWLLERFPNCKLVLATSTPLNVNTGEAKIDEVANARVIALNEKVWAVAKTHNLPVDDLYGKMFPHPEWHVADGCHFNETGRDELGRQVAACILDILK